DPVCPEREGDRGRRVRRFGEEDVDLPVAFGADLVRLRGDGLDKEAVDVVGRDPELDLAAGEVLRGDLDLERDLAGVADEAFVVDEQALIVAAGDGGAERAGAEEAEQGEERDEGQHTPAEALDAPCLFLERELLVELESRLLVPHRSFPAPIGGAMCIGGRGAGTVPRVGRSYGGR